MDKELTPSEAIVKDDFEAYADKVNGAELVDRGIVDPPKKAAEPEKPADKTAAAEPEKPKAPRQMSYKELRARVRELEDQAKVLKMPSREEPKPAAETPKPPEKLRARPKSEDIDPATNKPKYETWQQYEDDLLAWNEEKILKAFEERSTKKTTETQIETVNKQIEANWNERVEKAREAHEDMDDALNPEGIAKLIQPGSLVDEWIMDSEAGAELLYFFHKNPAEFMKFEKIDGPTPGARRAKARRMLVAIEEKLSTDKGARSDEPEPKGDDEPIPAGKENRISKTPPPSREVGGRGAAPTDRVRAAVANNDVGAYIEEQNAREIRQIFGYRR